MTQVSPYTRPPCTWCGSLTVAHGKCEGCGAPVPRPPMEDQGYLSPPPKKPVSKRQSRMQTLLYWCIAAFVLWFLLLRHM